jgi:hypothetical protein
MRECVNAPIRECVNPFQVNGYSYANDRMSCGMFQFSSSSFSSLKNTSLFKNPTHTNKNKTRRPRPLELAIRFCQHKLRTAIGNLQLTDFSYVCPEPVLVK